MSETWENDQNLSSQWKKKRKKKFQFPEFGSDQICTHTNKAPEERVGREKENI